MDPRLRGDDSAEIHAAHFAPSPGSASPSGMTVNFGYQARSSASACFLPLDARRFFAGFFSACFSTSRERRSCRRLRTAASSGLREDRSSRSCVSISLLDVQEQAAVEVAGEDLRMHVAFAADARRVAEARGDLLDGLADVLLGLGLVVEFLEFRQGERRQHGAGPGAEILGRDLAPGDLLQIGVHVRRGDRMLLAVIVDILEQVLARQVLAGLDDSGDAPVLDLQVSRSCRSCP